jgi:sugar (pentulose or hexulose) kinase
MSSKSHILLDFGGTHTKSQVWCDGALVTQAIIRSPRVRRGPRGEATISARDFALHVLEVFESSSQHTSSPFTIAISSQMACFVLVDGSGRPSGDIVSWQDERSAHSDVNGVSTVQRVAQQLAESGHPLWDGLRSGLPLCYLSEMVRSEQYRTRVHLLSLAQFAILTLFPSVHPGQLKIHSSEAASSGLFDPVESHWDESTIAVLGLDRFIFPEVTNELDRVESGIPAFVPLGDFQAAVAGCSVGPHDLFVHVATGGQVARPVSRSAYRSESELRRDSVQVRPSAMSDSLLLAKTHLPAGRLLASLADLLSHRSDQEFWRFVNESVLRPCSVTSVFDAEKGYGFSLQGLSPRGLDPEEIATAVIQGVHSAYVEAAIQIGLSGVSRLVFSGGALTKLPNFMGKFEDELRIRSVRHSGEEDTSLKGLANLLGVQGT